jgi:hypothetical protein
MSWIALAAALELAAPQPIKYPTWFSLDDNPSYLHENRTVLVRATVRADGALQGCDIELSSGDPKLDTFTCGLVSKRAHYVPARSVDGQPMYGVDRMRVIWGPSPMPPSQTTHGDIDVTTGQFPSGVDSQVFVHVAFAANATGHVTSCGLYRRTGTSSSKAEAALAPIACQELMKRYTATPAKNDGGNAVPSIQTGYVRVSTSR